MATSPNRKGIPKSEAERLWGASAGRCNICGTSLLRDKTTAVEVKAGEKAHIVGVGDGPRSPRGRVSLPSKERNKAANLILLCEKHHTEVDARVDLYSRDRLLEIKQEFEERVFFLTGLSKDQATLVLRLQGDIHGSKVPDLTREQAREVVLQEENRYPRYALSSTEHDLSVDLRDRANEGEDAYWDEAARLIETRLQHLDQLRSDGNAGHVSVFALARTPILVQLGAALGDAGDVVIHHRRNDGGWGWDLGTQPALFDVVRIDEGGGGEGVVLACSLSGPVDIGRAPEGLKGAPRYEIRPVNVEPGATVLDHPDSAPAFRAAYRKFLSIVETDHPDASKIYLLPAVQADAAVAIGQIRTPAANPPLVIYDRDRESGRYELACEVAR